MHRILPEHIAEQFVTAWNKNDAEYLAAIFVDNADFVNVTGLWWQNKNDIYRAHDYGLRVIFNSAQLELKRTKVRYITDDIATVHARIRLTNQTALLTGEVPQVRNTLFLFVVQKIEGIWFCLAAQNAEVQSGKETFIKKEDGNFEAVTYGQFKK
ncbi:MULTISPECIES: SgcJ/EcaC family oxidoreductase [unclassified Myroides]|uniref:SgcJ/EcaC family oxidoreductase n=1 Tax=unclassified Myroides TaxID=2642485 RepID=UPI003D2F99C7